jgi:diacylglycerol kinase family enzyme
MRQRALVLLNRSVDRADEGIPKRIGDLLRGAPFDAAIEVVGGDSLAPSARRAVERGCQLLIAAGGDGTVSTVAAVAASHDATLGVLPLGTLNHFANDAGIPLDLDEAVSALTCGRIVSVDVGHVNGHAFLNNSSVGIYPRLLWERERQEQRGRSKWTALALAALRVWRQYRRMTVTIEGRGYRHNVCTPFVFIGNNEYSIDAGRIDARSSLDSGHLQLCMAPDADRSQMARIVLGAIAGRLNGISGFVAQPATELTIAVPSRKLGVSLDGELIILDSPLRYTIRRRALQVIVPSQKGRQ